MPQLIITADTRSDDLLITISSRGKETTGEEKVLATKMIQTINAANTVPKIKDLGAGK